MQNDKYVQVEKEKLAEIKSLLQIASLQTTSDTATFQGIYRALQLLKTIK